MKYCRTIPSFLVIFPVLLALMVGALGLNASSEAEPQVLRIENVKIRQIHSDKFYRISEFFTGKERQGKRIFLRTNPNYRGGLYFITRFDGRVDKLPLGIRVTLEYYSVGSAGIERYEFPLPAELKSTNRLFIGITADDDNDDSIEKPVAWRIQMINQDGSVYCEKKSYLWEMPEN